MSKQTPSRDPALFRGWDERQALAARDAIEGLIEHPGWEVFLKALEAHEQMERLQLLAIPPTTNGSEYADRVGLMKGLARARLMAENIIEHARFIEAKDRAEEG